MFKRTFKLAVVWAIACSALMISSTARADENSAVDGDLVMISGRAKFEKRDTMVPFCEGCPRSQVYWSLVLTPGEVSVGTTAFEVDHPFAEGSQKSPDAVELDGVVISPGSYVKMKARVHRISDEHSVLTGYSDVAVVMDLHTWSLSSVKKVGWNCLSDRLQIQPIDRPTSSERIYAEVYQAKTSGKSVYRMSVLSSTKEDDTSFREVARFDDVQNEARDKKLVYEGTTASKNSIGTLEIEIQQGKEGYMPSVLRISRTSSAKESVIGMRCIPARNSR